MKKSIFLDLFPPPDYLRMSATGLDISDRTAKYARFCRKGNSFCVNKFGAGVIPEGVIESGEIKQKDKLVDFLKSIREEIKSDYLIANLPEEKAFVVNVKLPAMDENQVRVALESQLEEHIPLLAREAVFDFDIIEKMENEEGINVNLVAFPKALVESYRDAIIEAGFIPLAFELEVQAAVRAMVPKNETGPMMLIDFGRTRTTFAITSNNQIQLTSTIKTGGEKLEKALVDGLGINQAQADKYKKEYGLIRNKNDEKVFKAMLPVVSEIKDELIKYTKYWSSHFPENKKNTILKILLSGGDSNLIGLPEYLAYESKMPVELGNPWVNIFSFEDEVPDIELRESLIYTTALGLALRQYEEKNEFFT